MKKILLKIDFVSDVVCPWCIIGYKRLEKAMEMFENEVTFDLHWHPFELNPAMPEGGENLREHLAKKYGTTLEGSIAARKRLTDMGAELGFTFNYYDEMRIWTLDKNFFVQSPITLLNKFILAVVIMLLEMKTLIKVEI